MMNRSNLVLSPRVLIVEDDSAWQIELQSLIIDAGYDCDLTSDLEIASKKILTDNYAVVIIDLELDPKSDTLYFEGYDLISAIQFLDEIKYRNCRTIIVSAFGNQEKMRQAFKYGAFDFIRKQQFSPDQLLVDIKSIIDLWIVETQKTKERDLSADEHEKYNQLTTG